MEHFSCRLIFKQRQATKAKKEALLLQQEVERRNAERVMEIAAAKMQAWTYCSRAVKSLIQTRILLVTTHTFLMHSSF